MAELPAVYRIITRAVPATRTEASRSTYIKNIIPALDAAAAIAYI
jgi:hypothetical protein